MRPGLVKEESEVRFFTDQRINGSADSRVPGIPDQQNSGSVGQRISGPADTLYPKP